MVTILPSLSPVSNTPDSPQETPVQTTLPLLATRVSGSKHSFVRCPFKRVPVLPADSASPWWTEHLPSLFYCNAVWASLPGSGALSWGAHAVV